MNTLPSTLWALSGLSPFVSRAKLFSTPDKAFEYLQGRYGVNNVTREWRPKVPKKGKRSVEQPEHWQFWCKYKDQSIPGQTWDASTRYDLHELDVID